MNQYPQPAIVDPIVETGDKHVYTALDKAVNDRNYSDISKILNQNPNLDLYRHIDTTECLEWAVTTSNYRFVQNLVDSGADVNHKYHDGNTLLHMALYWNDITPCRFLQPPALQRYGWIIRLLVADMTPAEINSKNRDGDTPLCKMWQRGCRGDDNQYECTKLQLMIDHGADVNCKDRDGGTTLLHRAVGFNLINIAEILLRNEAGINFTDKYGRTPMVYIFNQYDPKDLPAIQKDSEKYYVRMMIILLHHGGDINSTYSDGLTILGRAILYNMVEVVEYMIHFIPSGMFFRQKELDLEKRMQSDGCTALHLACIMKNKYIAALLLEAGADRYAKDSEGNDALYYARRAENQDLINLMVAEAPIRAAGAHRVTIIDRLCREYRDLARDRQTTGMTDIAAIHRRLPERDYYPRSAHEPFDDNDRETEDEMDKLGRTLPIQSRYPRFF
jgi:ankyrin repeat protein